MSEDVDEAFFKAVMQGLLVGGGLAVLYTLAGIIFGW
jgi:hypothetical protein